VLVELELGVAEGPVAEVVDGRRGSDQDGVEEADGLGPVAGAAEARELGAVRTLKKPFKLDELVAIVQELDATRGA